MVASLVRVEKTLREVLSVPPVAFGFAGDHSRQRKGLDLFETANAIVSHQLNS